MYADAFVLFLSVFAVAVAAAAAAAAAAAVAAWNEVYDAVKKAVRPRIDEVVEPVQKGLKAQALELLDRLIDPDVEEPKVA